MHDLSPTDIDLKKDRVEYWLGVGAQPTATVKRLLRKDAKASA